MRYCKHDHYDHSEGATCESVQSFDRPCAPLRLQSREMQPRGVQGYPVFVQYTLSNICNGKIWGTNPRPNMYVVYVVMNELKLGFGSRRLVD